MGCIGLGAKWRKCILVCLSSASISILINGSPTQEFFMGRGVQQGDPSSPFLFILAAEGLNILIKAAVDRNLFNGVEVGSNKVLISHLQYADDTNFFGEWSRTNARNLISILKCFKLSSGLKVNFSKSCLYGAGVKHDEVVLFANRMGCLAFYLSWLTDWSYDEKFGGLGPGGGLKIGSLKSKNLALLGKWWWKFNTKTDCLWVKLIRSIYGIDGGLWAERELTHIPPGGIWNNIVRAGWKCSMMFPLKIVYMQLVLVKFITHGVGVEIILKKDSWSWDLASNGLFIVKKLTSLIDDKLLCFLGSSRTETVRNKLIPKKVEIFVWRALQKGSRFESD
ncbi:uncharacterized protein [Rutidosis leptorrhynchoides]|uniref:uncharacterized protein n=1 Tax=Rutidosis leptorrhynchoides TaxID=125765 RepID=UPI003A9A2368